jgi:hypothetical protein
MFVLSTATQWVKWSGARNIPDTFHHDVQVRLNSNLKHLLVGMELKTAATNKPVTSTRYCSSLLPVFSEFLAGGLLGS